MALQIPPSVNYQSPLVSIPSLAESDAKEGPRMVNLEIDWGTMGGASNCVSVNPSNNATLTFSQILALSVDNSTCGSDVRFTFPDTQETVTIPAYAPKIIVPVFTNQTQFFVQALGEEPQDITKFSILNFVPPPIALPLSQEQNIANIGAINVTANGSTQLIAAGINGALEGAFISFYGSTGSGASVINWTLQDGSATPVVLAAGSNEFGTGTGYQGLAFQLNGLQVRFQNGVKLSYTITATVNATYSANLYYRTP